MSKTPEKQGSGLRSSSESFFRSKAQVARVCTTLNSSKRAPDLHLCCFCRTCSDRIQGVKCPCTADTARGVAETY